MRLKSLEISDVDHIKKIAVEDLADIVVIAGPNGVGKSRALRALIEYFRDGVRRSGVNVIVEATSEPERREWGKSILDTRIDGDVSHLFRTVKKNQRRNKYKSSVLNFESDRAVRNVAQYKFSWEVSDPYEEDVPWNLGYGYLRDRFADVQHTIFRRVESQRRKISAEALELKAAGADHMPLNFPDPLQSFKDVFAQLLAPKRLLDADLQRQQLTYEFEGKHLSLSQLSSGEREVVNIAFDLTLRNPSDCIIVFDEPELHLHPELSYRLLQTLSRIGARNQFILCTHSPEIITASLENTVVFLSPNKETVDNQAIVVSRDDQTNQALHLLGQSIGIISLGKKLVLVEGDESSLDKQTYGAILKNLFPELVLVPVGGKHTIRSFNLIREHVLNRTIWGVEFFLLCDRDASYQLGPKSVQHNASPRLRVLPRYHIENYFLDENVLARAFAQFESEDHWLRDAKKIRDKLREIARGLIAYAVALKVAAIVREKAGQVDLMPRGISEQVGIAELVELFRNKALSEGQRVSVALNMASVEELAREEYAKLASSIELDTALWLHEIPGRPMLSKFARAANLQVGRLKNMYLASAAEASRSPFSEVIELFGDFSTAAV